MTEPNFSINFTARMLATEACAAGDVLVYHKDDGLWRVATAANRTAARAGAQAIALTDYGGSVVGKVTYQSSGVLSSEFSGLSDIGGSTVQLVRTSASGQLERIGSYTSGDDIVGYAFADGRVALHIGLPWAMIAALAGGGGGGFTPPTGTGFAHVTGGALDAASKKVDLTASADVTGTLPVGNGGTGLTSPGTSGNVLKSNGTLWTSAAPDPAVAAGAAGDIQVKAPSGTGLNVVGYWKAVDNAGRLRATYWDPVDGVTVRSVLEVSAGANTGASEILPTTGFIRISDSIGNTFPLITRRRSGSDQSIISSSGGAVDFGDDTAVTTTNLRGWQTNIVSGAGGIDLTASGGGFITANSTFKAFDARLWVLLGLDSGVLNTSGLSLGSSTIATSGGTTTLTSAQAASLSLVFTGTGGTINAPDRTRNVYFVDASAASGAIVIQDGAATGVTVAAGKCDIIFHDGTNYRSFLTNASGTGITALANVGTGTGLVWRDTTSGTANLKSLKVGSFVTITNNTSDVTIGVDLTTGPVSIGTSGAGAVTIGSASNDTTINSLNVKSSLLSTTDIIDTVARVQTTNATLTTIATLPLPNNAVTTIDVRVTACKSDSSSADAWTATGTYKNAAGTAADVQTAVVTHRGATAWSFTMTRTTTTIYFQVTGAASNTIEWAIDISYQTTRQS